MKSAVPIALTKEQFKALGKIVAQANRLAKKNERFCVVGQVWLIGFVGDYHRAELVARVISGKDHEVIVRALRKINMPKRKRGAR